MKKRWMALVAFTCMIACIAGCANNETDTVAQETVEETESMAHETKVISLEVVDPEGASTVMEVTTEAEVLLDALRDVDGFTIDGKEEDWGFFVTSVNGIVANYEEDGAYWAFYVNGEMAKCYVSEQPVTAGDTYSFKYEVYSE